MFGERDKLMGVSDNIMMGNMCPLGTGSFDLLLDESALESAFDVQVGGGEGMEAENVGRCRQSMEKGAGGGAGGGTCPVSQVSL